MQNFPQGSPFGDMFKQYFGQDGQMSEQQTARPTHALGSGFIIDAAGFVVTNNHVIDDAHDIKVTMTDGAEYSAHIVGRDLKTDLALLKIDAGKPLPYVAFGDSSKERAGDWVVAVGNPYGLGGTVTAGIVSAHDRNINAGAYDDFLQIDAPINPGNSGGPLFDQSGHVIGIDTAIYSPSGGSVGIGFAIPSNLAKNIVAQLRDHGKVERGWLGVQMQELTPALAKAVGRANGEGVLVDEVQADSPAAQAMLKQGDVITAFNGMQIKTPRDLAVAVANSASGKSATLSVWRDQHTSTLNLTIRTQPAEQVASAETNASPASVGMNLKPLTDDDRGQLGLDSSIKGVVVGQVEQDSPAAKSGVEAGDVIVRVGNDEVTTPSQAVEDIATARRAKKEAIPLLVMREGTTYYLGLQLASG
jgi:serine protease Do